MVCFSVHFHIECTVKKSVLSMFMLKLRNQYTYFVGILSRYICIELVLWKSIPYRYICIELVLWKSIPYRDIRVSAKPGYALICLMAGIMQFCTSFSDIVSIRYVSSV